MINTPTRQLVSSTAWCRLDILRHQNDWDHVLHAHTNRKIDE